MRSSLSCARGDSVRSSGLRTSSGLGSSLWGAIEVAPVSKRRGRRSGVARPREVGASDNFLRILTPSGAVEAEVDHGVSVYAVAWHRGFLFFRVVRCVVRSRSEVR